MYCRECGTQNEENTWKCADCGVELHGAPQQPVQVVQIPTSEKAIGSLICSLVGLLMCFFVEIAGIVLGYKAKKEIRASQGRLGGEEYATAGIIIGWITLGLHLLLVLFFAIPFIIALVAIVAEMAAG